MSAAASFRLGSGGRIDRSIRVRYTFDGKTGYGHPGDTLASALLANGERLVGRSFKYHRPRGIVSAGVEEPNALVQLIAGDDEPNVRATTLALTDGLSAQSVNRWPSLGFDLGAMNDWLSPLFPAGFYYKTFMGGPGWKLYGPIIRRMAGLGRSPTRAGSHRYEKRFHHCDVLVAGAGPAGLVAALVAARSGARVLLADDRCEPGGQLLETPSEIDGRPALDWVTEVVTELDVSPNVVRLSDATVAGYYDHNFLTIVEQRPAQSRLHERLWKVRAGQVVIATGAMERPLVFADNDRPGVMLAQAARAYAFRFGVLAGRRAVFVTNNSSAYEAAIDLARSGMRVVAIVDTRERIDEALASVARSLDIEVLLRHTIVSVKGVYSVSGVDVAPRNSPQRARRLMCDLVLMSGGWNPLVHLHSQSGGRPTYDTQSACFCPGESMQAERSAGAARGVFSLGDCVADGIRAGSEAVESLGKSAASLRPFGTASTAPLAIEPCWELPGASRRAKAFVDYQNDVTTDDLRLAVSENFVSVEHVKRYTTTGMGTDQGKLGNANAIGLLSNLLERDLGQVGTTTYRPPYTPVSFGAIAGNDVGDLIVPSRRTPITSWNEARHAAMFEAGAAYRRPSYYPRNGETMALAINREVKACRNSVGIYDGSPLGKFELRGPDSVSFLERIYTNRWADLEVNQGRFGLMLREDGRLLDDGVAFRIGDNRYWLFCGTGGAEHMHAHLERLLQLEWPELRVFLTVVTAQWANICVCGPNAKDVLRAAGTDVDLEPAAFPFMSLKYGEVAGIPARIARVGYTGEMSFEVNVRSRDGLRMWETLMTAGESYGITPIGSESSMVMRCEKGFVSAGYEGDGIVNPYDAGLGWVVDESKTDFIGKRMLVRDRNVGGVRPKVVGLLPDAADFCPPDGTPLLDGKNAYGEPNVVGYVTQGCYSPTLERSIALGVLDDGRNRMGDKVTIAAVSQSALATVTKPCFVDPAGTRMR